MEIRKVVWGVVAGLFALLVLPSGAYLANAYYTNFQVSTTSVAVALPQDSTYAFPVTIYPLIDSQYSGDPSDYIIYPHAHCEEWGTLGCDSYFARSL